MKQELRIKQIVKVTLNLPWTVIGFVGAILSMPYKVEFSKNPPALVFHVRSFWWYAWLPGQKGIRGMANGNIVQVGKNFENGDKEHELIHIEQFMRTPLVHPVLYFLELLKHGVSPRNKYEKEAYERANNNYHYS